MTEPVIPQPIPAEAVSDDEEATEETIVVRVSVRSPHALCCGSIGSETQRASSEQQQSHSEHDASTWQRLLAIVGAVLEIALNLARRWFSHGP